VRAAVGDAFDESPENLTVLYEVEAQKNAYLLNAISHLCNNQIM